MYPYLNQQKFKRDGRGPFYAIQSRWLESNHVNLIASEAEEPLQMSMYDGKKKTLNWEKYGFRHFKYYIILKNLKEYGYQGIDPGTNIYHLLSGIRCDKLSMVVATLREHPDKYEKDFDAVTYLSKCVDEQNQH